MAATRSSPARNSVYPIGLCKFRLIFHGGINYLGTRHCNWILPSRFRILSPALRPASSRSQLEMLAKVSFRVQVMIAPVASAACFVPRPGVERFSMHWKRKDDDRRLVFPLKILWRSFEDPSLERLSNSRSSPSARPLEISRIFR